MHISIVETFLWLYVFGIVAALTTPRQEACAGISDAKCRAWVAACDKDYFNHIERSKIKPCSSSHLKCSTKIIKHQLLVIYNTVHSFEGNQHRSKKKKSSI